MYSRWKTGAGLLALLIPGLLLGCYPGRGGEPADPGGAAMTPMPPGSPGGGGPVETPPAECKKVDILFVIDNSGSMADNQKSLIASFPGFVAGMRSRLANAEDFRVGVVTSDAYNGNEAGCRQIGDLVTRTGGPQSSNKLCGPFDGGGRFMTSADPRLAERFACAAQVGTGGDDDERVAKSLLRALSPETAAPGACNAGFRRKDALLVIVLISDEDDVPDGCDGDGKCMSYGSGGTPDEWYQQLVKQLGRSDGVVTLSLIGRRGDNPCGAVPASRLLRFTSRFGASGFVGDICASSYDRFFEDALPVIKDACKIFIPG